MCELKRVKEMQFDVDHKDVAQDWLDIKLGALRGGQVNKGHVRLPFYISYVIKMTSSTITHQLPVTACLICSPQVQESVTVSDDVIKLM